MKDDAKQSTNYRCMLGGRPFPPDCSEAPCHRSTPGWTRRLASSCGRARQRRELLFEGEHYSAASLTLRPALAVTAITDDCDFGPGVDLYHCLRVRGWSRALAHEHREMERSSPHESVGGYNPACLWHLLQEPSWGLMRSSRRLGLEAWAKCTGRGTRGWSARSRSKFFLPT